MITTIIIAVTCIISFLGFSNKTWVEKLIFSPPAVKSGQWYRLFTYGFLHADWTHLIFNMFSFYIFGREIEKVFLSVFGNQFGMILFVLMYSLGLFVSIFPTYLKEKDNYLYRGLGASGAVSAIVFAFILIYPMSYMGLFFIPIYLPAFLFGFIYIIISIYLDKNQSGNINHLAHITGGIFGIIFMFLAFMIFAHINVFAMFIDNIQITSIKDLIRFGY